jgi:hypothetical protein
MKLDLKANRLSLSDPLSKAIPCNENCGTLSYPHNGDFGPVTLAASDFGRTALPAIRRDSEPLKSIGTTSLRFGSCLLSDGPPLFAETNYIAGRTEFQAIIGLAALRRGTFFFDFYSKRLWCTQK